MAGPRAALPLDSMLPRTRLRASRTVVRVLFVTALSVTALLASACGSDSSGTDTSAAAADAEPAGIPGIDEVRGLEVVDVATGETTTLADRVDGDRPVLLWFWAPH